jgi:hypothetical protein
MRALRRRTSTKESDSSFSLFPSCLSATQSYHLTVRPSDGPTGTGNATDRPTGLTTDGQDGQDRQMDGQDRTDKTRRTDGQRQDRRRRRTDKTSGRKRRHESLRFIFIINHSYFHKKSHDKIEAFFSDDKTNHLFQKDVKLFTFFSISKKA